MPRCTPAVSSMSTSSSSACGDTTTPLPMKQVTLSRRMPDGIRCKYGFFAGHHQCVPGVVAALKAHHALGMIGEPVHNLALAFISPLRADDDDVLGHVVIQTIYQKLFCHRDDFPFALVVEQHAVAVEFAAIGFMAG